MKFLLLNGHGIDVRVSDSTLKIKDGRTSTEDPTEYSYKPKRIDVNHILVYGQNGNITIDAIRWLMKHNIQLSILNWDGKLLTTMLPPQPTNRKTRFAQYHSYLDEDLRIEVAKKFLEAKFMRTKAMLEYLGSRYPDIDIDFAHEYRNLLKAQRIHEMMIIEARVARHYWSQFSKVIPKDYDFESRTYQQRPWGAGDQLNCMLNYGYSILEGECMRAINSVGLDVHIGFLHEMSPSKNSLAYDLQEPFRFLVDLAVINLIEKNKMTKKDFIRTENYNLRLRPSGAKKMLDEINEMFNTKVRYNGNMCSWFFVLLDKTRNLAHHLNGKKGKLDFNDPQTELKRDDTEEIRRAIVEISYKRWEDEGYSKGTLHQLKQKVENDENFALNNHVKQRILKCVK